MTVLIHDRVDTGSGSTVNIPNGYRSHMLVACIAVGRVGSTPSTSTPTGGGGTWTNRGDEDVSWTAGLLAGQGAYERGYIFTSTPTERGASVSFDLGSYSGSYRRYSVFSLSNAEYYQTETVPMGPYVEVYDLVKFSRQGSMAIGLQIGLAPEVPAINSNLYDAIVDNAGYLTLTSYEEIIRMLWGINHCVERGQRSLVSPYQRYVQGGTDWNTSAAASASVMVALDAVECEI